MKYLKFLGAFFFSVCISGPILVFAVDNPMSKRVEYKPSLSIGGTWKVEVEKMSEAPGLREELLENWKPTRSSVVFQFTVEALEDNDSERCYRVRIDYKTLDGKPYVEPVEYFRIYLRQAELTLKKVERLNAKTDRVQAFRLFESGPVDVTDWVGCLPLAFPAFQEGQFDQEPPGKKSKVGVVHKSSDRCLQKEEIVRMRVDGKEADTLRITLEKGGDDGFPGHTTQTWVKGEPWWTAATCDRDGRQGRSAKLLKN